MRINFFLKCEKRSLIATHSIFFLCFPLQVKSLKTIRGESVKASVGRLLAHMISNQVAQQINWLGKGGKIAFSKLNINTVLQSKKLNTCITKVCLH